MNIFNEFREVVVKSLEVMVAAGNLPSGLDFSRIAMEPPREASHGDMATNAAMVLAKAAGCKPVDLARALSVELAKDERVVSVDIAGPGFINLKLQPSVWQNALRGILSEGVRYGDSTMGAGCHVNVEYVSANPTGPMHTAHARGAVFGDALARLLQKAGFDVTKEYYVNDAGRQVEILGRSTFLRYKEALGEDIGEIPPGFYPGEYLKEIGVKLAQAHGESLKALPEEEWLPLVRGFAISEMLAEIKTDLISMGVNHDVFTSERALVESGAVEKAFATLVEMGLVYEGVLEPPRGKTPEDWEPRPQTLFRATQFGDDVDRPLKKSDGSWTYFANDIAYHFDKYCRGFSEQIDVLGADHGGYVKRMQSALTAISCGKARLDVKLMQMVSTLDNGVPVRMSKRAGTFVTLRDVLDRVGRDVVRFIMLTRRNDQTLEFDYAKVTEQSRDNPVFYVQYAYARCCSVIRNAAEMFPGLDVSAAELAKADVGRLGSEEELALMRQLALWPRMVEAAAEAHEPHRIAYYLMEIAAAFHALWTKGREDANLRFLYPDDMPQTVAHLALLASVQTVLACGFDVMGVVPVEEMR
ncbi:MAG TPA: arginine--tRNA ligase [Rhodospirillaceae bacterium]|nr:MAG: arginine--tRNA ligase [Alphaproteobacteria bacterium GWF2_58_20]HAU29363.1 arginine--tRNA ligase [Rhodospirillaceae bacterium]